MIECTFSNTHFLQASYFKPYCQVSDSRETRASFFSQCRTKKKNKTQKQKALRKTHNLFSHFVPFLSHSYQEIPVSTLNLLLLHLLLSKFLCIGFLVNLKTGKGIKSYLVFARSLIRGNALWVCPGNAVIRAYAKCSFAHIAPLQEVVLASGNNFNLKQKYTNIT